MTLFICALGSLIVVWALAFLRAPGIIWTVAFAAGLIHATVSVNVEASGIYWVWGFFLLAAIILNVPFLRRIFLTNAILALYRKLMPRMSRTEQEALEAGTVWWDAELFTGRPNWEDLLRYPTPTLSKEEQAFLEGPVEELCRMLDDWKINEEFHDLPPEVWQFMKTQGFFGMIILKKYGGLEFSALAHSTVVMKIASRSITAAVTVMVPNSLGPGELLHHYGTDEQKNYYLPRLARGEEIPCFALTSLNAGSDAASMTDSGVVCKGRFNDQSDVLGIRLNWSKRYITLGPVATLLGLAFKLYDPDHLLGDQEEYGITVALIPTHLPGIEIGRRHVPANVSFQNGPNMGRDVFVPLDFIIGGVKQAGSGWSMLMESLAAGRSISLPALSTGASKLASRATGAYARIRRQFKLPIGRFEGIEEALARIAGLTYINDAARIMTAGAVDRGEKPSVLSAIVKYHLTEQMRQVVNDAMDIQGGSGISLGPRNFMGRVYQAIPISITVEGANILTRNLIIFGQGAIRCHPYVLKELKAAKHPDRKKGAREFDQAFWGHIGFAISNTARSLFHGLTHSYLASKPGAGPTRRYYQHLTRMSACFAITADISMLVLGSALKKRELLSARLGDVLSHLYLASATLRHFEEQGRKKEDLPLLQWSLEYSLMKIQEALDRLIQNFPNRLAAGLVRVLVFPIGRPYKEPSDRLAQKVAGLLLEPSATRDRLTSGIFLPADVNESTGRLDLALQKVCQAEPLEKKLALAVRSGKIKSIDEESLLRNGLSEGVITEQEGALIREADRLRREVLTVDDFSPEELVKRVFHHAVAYEGLKQSR